MKYTKFYSTFALFFICAFSYAQTSDNLNRLDSFLNVLESKEQLMGTVTISGQGELLYEWAGGTAWHNGLEVRDNSVQSVMSIGSASKMFTAVLTMQMVEEGKLELDQRLDYFFPQIDGADQIKLRHLLQHQSGLFNFTSDTGMLYKMHLEISRDDMVQTFSNYRLMFEPGSQINYSNTNYVLLSYILEEVSGLSFDQLISENILERAGLKSTYFTKRGIPSDQLTNSFIKTANDWVTMLPEIKLGTTMGAGGVVSTGRDMIAFMDALFAGDLISCVSLDEMLQFENGFGKGILQLPFSDDIGFGHYGQLDEYYSFIAHFPSRGLTLSILLNGLDLGFENTINSMLKLMMEEDQQLPDYTSTLIQGDDLRALTGDFFSGESGMEFNISIESGKLIISNGKESKTYMIQIGDLLFKDWQNELEFIFELNGSGEANRLKISNSGGVFLLERRPEMGS
ncbi:MAG: class A beta-lactamase-related serine hydrolase [Saprospirales bacterium]|nr:MAG: class A beta-lactamase-related serine hydrolase [Saprospirales bacterium]